MNPYEIEQVGKLVQAERLLRATEDYLLAEARRERREQRNALWRQRLAAWLERLPASGRARSRKPQSEPR
jgi:hypothetical protein